MKKIFLNRAYHRDSWRYTIKFDYDTLLTSTVKGIRGVQFSSTLKRWYVDESEEALREVVMAFRDKAEIDISAISLKSTIPEPGSASQEIDHESLNSGMETHVESPDESRIPDEVNRARTVIEIVPEETTHDDLIPDNVKSSAGKTSLHSSYSPVEFRIDDKDGRLSIRFTGYYDKNWIDEIKTYGKTYYDKTHREFLLKWSKLTVDSLSDYFSSRGVAVRVIRPQINADTLESRKTYGEDVRSRQLSASGCEGLELLRRHLEENRYSVRTVESYLTLLEFFFKYFNDTDPGEISQNEVSDFMSGFIIKNGFSASYQNQIISAIKLYYEVSGEGRILPHILERPRRSRALPKVFSKEEVVRILNSTRNIKHKLLLWMIYSCGLRRSEATNIKLTDLDRNRNLLHIREGKGGVDRIVPVPDKVWKKLDEYIEGYNPRKYLFEGQGGEKYSVESVYNVFKQALKKACILKEVGVHSLRHSYATHLHENGLDIRYIQELLGHKSTRTTEIYTHVSRRNLIAVRSPIEDLDLK